MAKMGILWNHWWHDPRESESIAVRDNAPLSHLLGTFKKLTVHACSGILHREPTPLNHGAVLAVFEEALEMEGSPVVDDAIHSTPNLPDTGTHMENKVKSVNKAPESGAVSRQSTGPGKRKERPDGGSSAGADESPKRLKAS